MGKAVLGAAQARATAQGVAAGGMMRQGSVEDEIVTLCRDLDADYVVLDGPKAQREGSISSNETKAIHALQTPRNRHRFSRFALN